MILKDIVEGRLKLHELVEVLKTTDKELIDQLSDILHCDHMLGGWGHCGCRKPHPHPRNANCAYLASGGGPGLMERAQANGSLAPIREIGSIDCTAGLAP